MFAEICDLFHADQPRCKRLDVHGCVRIEVVTVLVKSIPERGDRKRAEIRINGEKIDNVAHLAEHNRAQRHQNDQTKNKRHPSHFHEIGFLDRLHADVMIEVVDLDQMLAIQAAALDFVGEDVEIESVGVLRRDQMHFPEREKDRHGNRCRGREQQQTRP